jgi:hypothetical protein
MDRIEKMNEVAAGIVGDFDGDPEAMFNAMMALALRNPALAQLGREHLIAYIVGFQVRAVCANA